MFKICKDNVVIHVALVYLSVLGLEVWKKKDLFFGKLVDIGIDTLRSYGFLYFS